MDSAIHIIYVLLYIVLAGYGYRIWRNDAEKRGWRYWLFLVTAALIWDNAVLGLGASIGAGRTLELLNAARFWMHALVTPLLVLVSLDLIRSAGAGWAGSAAARGWALLYTAFAAAMELGGTTLKLRLVPRMENGVLQYVNAGDGGMPWMIVLVMIPVAAAAYALWKYRRFVCAGGLPCRHGGRSGGAAAVGRSMDERSGTGADDGIVDVGGHDGS